MFSVALRGLKGVLRGPLWIRKVFFVALSGPSRIKRCSPWPFEDQKVFFRGSKRCSSVESSDKKKVFSVVLLRGPPWIKKVFFAALRESSRIKKVLRCSPRPSVDQKVFSVVLRPSVDQKGVLRGPSRIFADKKGVKVFSASLRGSKGVLRGPPWTKRCSPWPSVDKEGVPISPSRLNHI